MAAVNKMCGKFPKPGIILTLLACVCFSCNSVFNSVVFPTVGVTTPTVIRYLLQASLMLPMLFVNYKWIKTTWKELFMMSLSGFMMGGVTYTGFLAMSMIPPLDATVIFTFNTVFVLFIACLWLKERFGIFDVVNIALMIVGVFFVSQPEFVFGYTSEIDPTTRLTGIGLALCTATLVALANTTCRRLKNCDVYLLTTVQGFFGSAIVFIIDFPHLLPTTTTYELYMMLAGTFLGGFGRLIIMKALCLEDARIVSAVNVFESVTTATLQVIITGIVPNWLTILGTIIISSCVVLISLKEIVLQQIYRLLGKKECEETEDDPKQPLLSA